MLLTGTYSRVIDEKLRIAIPRQLRDGLGSQKERVYAAPGTDGSLALYGEAQFQRIHERLERESPLGRDVRAFSRLFFAQSQGLELDSQGRVRLPAELVSQAGLTGSVVVLGVRDHVEIWHPERWNEYLRQLQPAYDELAERAFERASGVQSGITENEQNEPLPANPR